MEMTLNATAGTKRMIQKSTELVMLAPLRPLPERGFSGAPSPAIIEQGKRMGDYVPPREATQTPLDEQWIAG